MSKFIIEILWSKRLAKCIQATADFQNSSDLAYSFNFITSDKDNADKLFDIQEVLCLSYVSF